MIKHIVFDLGNVVVNFQLERALERFLAVCTASKETVIEFFTRSEADRLFVEGKISGDVFYQEARKVTGCALSFSQFQDAYNNIFEENKGIERIVHALVSEYPLSILSNTNPFHYEYIQKRFPIIKQFSNFFLSYELHCQKPDRKIYEYMIKKLGIHPCNVLFVDDLQKNISAAREMGIYGIRFESVSQIVSEMERCGIRALL